MLEIKDATYWAEQLKSGNLSAKALLEMTNDKIQKLNPRYNAIVAYDLEKAKAEFLYANYQIYICGRHYK